MVCLTLSHPSRQCSLGLASTFSLLASAKLTVVQCGCWIEPGPIGLVPVLAAPAAAPPEFTLDESPKSARSFWMLCGCGRDSAGRLNYTGLGKKKKVRLDTEIWEKWVILKREGGKRERERESTRFCSIAPNKKINIITIQSGNVQFKQQLVQL